MCVFVDCRLFISATPLPQQEGGEDEDMSGDIAAQLYRRSFKKDIVTHSNMKKKLKLVSGPLLAKL